MTEKDAIEFEFAKVDFAMHEKNRKQQEEILKQQEIFSKHISGIPDASNIISWRFMFNTETHKDYKGEEISVWCTYNKLSDVYTARGIVRWAIYTASQPNFCLTRFPVEIFDYLDLNYHDRPWVFIYEEDGELEIMSNMKSKAAIIGTIEGTTD